MIFKLKTIMSNNNSDNGAKSANNDKEETIFYIDMPKNVREQCSPKNDPTQIIANIFGRFSSKLTVDTAGAQQVGILWNILKLALKKNKYFGQIYLIMQKVKLHGHL